MATRTQTGCHHDCPCAQGRGRTRTPEQQARAELRVKIEAAKLRIALDNRLNRKTPAWVIELARGKAG